MQGPIVGSFTGQYINWRVVQAVLGSFSGVILIVGSIFVPETYAVSILLSLKHEHEADELLASITSCTSEATGKVFRKILPRLNGRQTRASHQRSYQDFSHPSLGVALPRTHRSHIKYLCGDRLWHSIPIILCLSASLPSFERLVAEYRQSGFHTCCSGNIMRQFFTSIQAPSADATCLQAVSYIIFIANPGYIKQMKKHGGRAPAEARLPPAIVGSVALVVGLVWFAAS